MGLQDAPVVENTTQRQPWDDDPLLQPANATQRQPWDDDPVLYSATGTPEQLKYASGVSEAIQAGYEGSATGLIARGELPSIQLNPDDSKWYERLAAGATQLVTEAPFEIAGAVGGALAGGAAGSAVPVVGNAAGAVVGAGAGTFALPTAIRESYIQAYQKGEIENAADFLGRAKLVLKATGKDAVVGGLTAGVGRAVGLGGQALGWGTKTTAGAALTAEGTTMVVTPAALEGRLPEAQDFTDAAVMLVGLKGVGMASRKLMNIYAKTGKTPIEVMADAKDDPTIREDLLTPEPAKPSDVAGNLATAENTPSLATEPPSQNLPSDLAGAKPRYNFQDKGFELEFASDVDKALFITAQKTPSKRDGDYRAWLKSQGLSDEQIASEGSKVRAAIKDQAGRMDAPETLRIEKIFDHTNETLQFEETHTDLREPLPALMTRFNNGFGTKGIAVFGIKDGRLISTYVSNEIHTPGINSGGAVTKVYEAAIAEAQKRGLAFVSDESVTASAARVYDSLAKRGYKVERNPEAKLAHDRWTTEDGSPVFTVEPKAQPVAPKSAAEPEQLNLFSENELPRAYKEMAAEINKREAVPEPSKEAAEFLAKPFADVPQLPGEPVLKTHVNYNYLNTADDVKGAMSRLSELYEADIQKATRGTVPWEQTYAEARELYQKTTGEQPPALPLENADYAKLSADLYARKQLLTSGAEQLMDLRNKYAEAKTAGLATDQMKLELLAQIDRVAQAQAAVRGSQAEVGRALNILKSTNRDKAYYDQLTDVLNGRFGVEGKALGSANFDTMVEMMGQLGSPGEALKFAEKAAKATTWEKIVEAWKAGLVSGPVTQVANIMGNTTFMATRPLVDAVAVAVGGIRRDPSRMSAVEPLARVVGNIHGTIDGAKAAFAVLKTGEALGGKSEAPRTAIEGKLGEAIRTPFRLLSSADAFFRITNERGEAYSQAVREATKEGYNPATREFRDRVLQLVNNPTDKMQEAIDTAGVRFTFNMPLGEKGKQIQRTIRDLHLQWAVPFVQTPANVFKEMTRLTPAAPLIKEWREAFAKGGPEADKAVAELVVGTAVFTTVFSMALSGQITGQGDPDPRKRATQLASGWQPYSIKIGNTYYSYQRLQPVGTLIGMAADSAAVWDNMTPDESDKLPKIMSTAFANAITNQTFLQGITNIVNALSDPSRFGPRFVQNMTASLVPGVVGQTAQMMDPYQREVYSVLDAVQARIPGMSENLMPKRDVFGEPVAARDRMGAISPITRTVESDDKVRLEAARLKVGVSKAPDYVELPAGRDSKLGRVELTAEQKDVFATKAGQQAHQVLSAVVGTPMWDSTPDYIQRQIMKSVFEDARSYARDTALTPEQIQTEVERISAELQRRLQPK